MKGLGTLILFAGVAGLLFALNMDTSVSTGFGSVNNLGLMNDKQNYIIVSALAIIVGLLMIILSPTSSPTAQVSEGDPFDQAKRNAASMNQEAINERKRYAVSLGITREGGRYVWGDHRFNDYEEAIAYVEEHQGQPDF